MARQSVPPVPPAAPPAVPAAVVRGTEEEEDDFEPVLSKFSPEKLVVVDNSTTPTTLATAASSTTETIGGYDGFGTISTLSPNVSPNEALQGEIMQANAVSSPNKPRSSSSPDYKLGDISRSIAHGVQAVVQKGTEERRLASPNSSSDYVFGDFTRGVIKTAMEGSRSNANDLTLTSEDTFVVPSVKNGMNSMFQRSVMSEKTPSDYERMNSERTNSEKSFEKKAVAGPLTPTPPTQSLEMEKESLLFSSPERRERERERGRGHTLPTPTPPPAPATPELHSTLESFSSSSSSSAVTRGRSNTAPPAPIHESPLQMLLRPLSGAFRPVSQRLSGVFRYNKIK